jgi:hypothetical protein
MLPLQPATLFSYTWCSQAQYLLKNKTKISQLSINKSADPADTNAAFFAALCMFSCITCRKIHASRAYCLSSQYPVTF